MGTTVPDPSCSVPAFWLNSSHICFAFLPSSRGLLACTSLDVSRRPAGPQSFCMNYSVWFLHTANMAPTRSTPPLTHTQYSIRSWFHLATILDQCQTFFKSPSFHLLKYCVSSSFQMKHAFWPISSFLASLQACSVELPE